MNVRSYGLKEVNQCDMCKSPIQNSQHLGLRLDKSQGMKPRGKAGVAISIYKCTSCELIFASPEPRPANLTDHYDIPVETYWNEAQLSQDLNIMSRFFPTTKELLNFAPGMKALDIGTGIGTGLVALKQAGFDAWAIEPSPSFRKEALKRTGETEDRIILASIEDAEFPDEQFDLVSFGAVFEHLYDPSIALEKSVKWLRHGGIWYAEVPSSQHLTSKLIDFYFKLAGTSFTTHLSPMHSPFHIHEFTHRTFELFGARTGLFEVASRFYEVCPVRHFPRILHPMMTKIMERTDGGMQLHIWLRRP